MGKPTGFLEFARETSTAISPKDRIKNFDEFHIPLPLEKQRQQGGRCMDCGDVRCTTSSPSGTTVCIPAIWRRPMSGCTRPTTSRSLPPGCARLCAKQPAPAALTETRCPPRKTSIPSLRMLTKKVMRHQSHPKREPVRRLQSSVPALPGWRRQIS